MKKQEKVEWMAWQGTPIKETKEVLMDMEGNPILWLSDLAPGASEKTSLAASFDDIKADILFTASALFAFTQPQLRYYYWKHYPRKDTDFNYISPQALIAKKEVLISFLSDWERYAKTCSIQDALHRLYVDSQLSFFPTHYTMRVDHEQKWLHTADTKALRIPFLTKIHTYLYRDMIHRGKGVKFVFYLQSLLQTLKVLFHNKGEHRFYKLFRYATNHGVEVKRCIEKLLSLIEAGTPFCFSHFNDGELTFISKYQKGNHREVWYGRRLNQYNETLGRLLVSSFLFEKENYFVGIPCGQCHPRLNRLASSLRTSQSGTLTAMTLHHNIQVYPKIFGLLKNKNLYFITNPYQDLTFFSELGLDVKEQNRINVPFKNAHKEYDRLKDFKFDEHAVVLMMCGMLGKVLTPVWFEQNPTCTFLTFGSSFDDLIQRNINFNVLPKRAPFARHLIGTRSFLFGAKRRCPNCFDLQNPEARA